MQARQLIEIMKISQPTLSRALRYIGDDIVRIGAGPSIQYALRDVYRGFGSVPIYCITMKDPLDPLARLFRSILRDLLWCRPI
ncbi:MAG: hypothetical protein P4L95_22710 [Rouxiella aceris]|uniref:hypothetical protein n=1 Tax=Rouxiella aceris TaxID=2703884 RepID=UPI00284003F9|nr:hypothetical protein [Rouxiella aceris]MDR3434676.1 hypothetical protein [Rouxiella aceris]